MQGLRVDDIWSPVAQSLLRMVAGAMLLHHGLGKLPFLASRGLPPLSGLWASGMVELLGGALLLVGLLTRPVALICGASAAATYLITFAPRSPWPMHNGGELTALYGMVFLYLAFAGAGAWSLDARCTPAPRSPDPVTPKPVALDAMHPHPALPNPIIPSAWRTTFGRARPGAR